MIEVTLSFKGAEQPSVQVGDIAYQVAPNTAVGGFQNASQTNLIKIGKVTSVDRNPSGFSNLSTGVTEPLLTIKCDMNNDQNPPATTDFILFSKDNTVNTTSLLGYYGAVKFKNDSTAHAEMFATSCEVGQSSK